MFTDWTAMVAPAAMSVVVPVVVEQEVAVPVPAMVQVTAGVSPAAALRRVRT